MPPETDHPDTDERQADKDDEQKKDGKDAKDEKDGKDGKDGKKDKKPSPLANPKVRIGLIVAGVVLLVGGIVWFVHYWDRGRFQQETNDAYLDADQVAIAPKVPGYVDQVLVADNQTVAVGQPLVKIDEHDVLARHDQALAQVAQGLAGIAQIEAQIHQQQAQIALSRATLSGAEQTARHAQSEVDRYAPLEAQGAQTAEQLESMRQQRDQAVSQVAADRAQRDAALRQIDTLKAQIGVTEAQVEQARAQARQAEDDLKSTLVRSSIAGRVGDRTVRVGQYVQPGTRMMSVVPVADVYLVANFKETQIGLMRVGQPATIEVDALSGVTLHGEVDSFAPGTGAQFALLPPQNATGNFTKVVQRVPVRIHVDADDEARKVLLPGLSVEVTVDTLGTKEEHEQAVRDSKREKDQRSAAHDAEVRRDRQDHPAGPGQ